MADGTVTSTPDTKISVKAIKSFRLKTIIKDVSRDLFLSRTKAAALLGFFADNSFDYLNDDRAAEIVEKDAPKWVSDWLKEKNYYKLSDVDLSLGKYIKLEDGWYVVTEETEDKRVLKLIK